MKVVLVDNLNREEVADVLHKENLSPDMAEIEASEWNRKHYTQFGYYAMVKEDDYKLWGGIKELV